jgi:hypothetical protein
VQAQEDVVDVTPDARAWQVGANGVKEAFNEHQRA